MRGKCFTGPACRRLSPCCSRSAPNKTSVPNPHAIDGADWLSRSFGLSCCCSNSGFGKNHATLSRTMPAIAKERERAWLCCRGESIDGGRGESIAASERHQEQMATTGKYLATQEEMVEARISLGSRDLCSKLLIPLNKCRQEEFYLPWKCEDERHTYEKCEYDIFLQRMKKMQEIRQKQSQQVAIPATQ